MPRYGIISDIHANLHALRVALSVLHDADVDEFICLGDIVGYGPHPAQCLDLVLEHCSIIVRGNHDEAILNPSLADSFNRAARHAILWTRSQLDNSHLAAIGAMPAVLEVEGLLTCIHDCPVPAEWDYVNDEIIAAQAFGGFDTSLCMLGHTHVPMVFSTASGEKSNCESLVAPAIDPAHVMQSPLRDRSSISLLPTSRYICNPGSVGQPRDYDPRASFAIFDTDQMTFSLLRREYDIDEARLATHRAGLPTILGDRLVVGA